MATKVPETIRAALILARSPIVVPALTKFESQYIKYKYELEKRLMWTFPAYYYFKKGTMSEYKFQVAQKSQFLNNLVSGIHKVFQILDMEEKEVPNKKL